MKNWVLVALIEIDLAIALVVAGGFSWQHAARHTEFASGEGQVAFTAVRYVPSWLILASLLFTVAGLLVIDAATRIRRRPPALAKAS
ncbi:hypothetical protein [Nocardia camponoti]|uniref:Uncharacterized protein n=1 Tax=Nocardia camponoti TaxID=1616106 RepID=A0A917QH70_9NOCA|nr:hypothetical protein [Nocardia camponoti]GGK50573.1 hypothetical protein GCM10011591_22630 [Nocardia camponoti]